MSGNGETRAFLVADLHLRPGDPESVARFARFLDRRAAGERVFVLGDLFDVWLGRSSLRVAGFAPAIEGLERASGRGVALDVVAGNRDFLLDEAFASRTGVRLHADGTVATLAGRRALLLHGDTLCTRDLAYQRYRRVVRSRLVRGLVRVLPAAFLAGTAGGLRAKSVRAVAAKLPEEKSIVPDAAARAAGAQGCDLVVCGHAHAASVRRVRGVTLLVLPAWSDEGAGVAAVAGRLWYADAAGNLVEPLPDPGP